MTRDSAITYLYKVELLAALKLTAESDLCKNTV